MVVALAAVVLAASPAAQEADDPTPASAGEIDAALDGLTGSLADRRPEDVLRAAGHQPPPLPLPDTADIDAAILRGRRWLLSAQNEDGSWGGAHNPGPYDDMWSNKYSHHGWTAATTGLVAMALMEQPETPAVRSALERSLRFLVEQEDLKRPSDWDVDNVWGLVYGLEGCVEALHDPRFSTGELSQALRRKADHFVGMLAEYQSSSGGWGYYDFDTLAKRPSWATSFMTSAAVVALHRATEVGIDVPEGMLERAVRGLVRSRLPNGAYDYSINAVPSPGRLEGINNVKGSLGRIQSCNYALRLVGDPGVMPDDLLTGLDQLFEHHRFLDVARQRPVPHEAYYANAGYFYYFAHYYAGKVLELLEPAERVRYAARLAREIIKTQEDDGSLWDYPMNSYHKPYGTAFSLLALERTRPEWSRFGRGVRRDDR